MRLSKLSLWTAAAVLAAPVLASDREPAHSKMQYGVVEVAVPGFFTAPREYTLKAYFVLKSEGGKSWSGAAMTCDEVLKRTRPADHMIYHKVDSLDPAHTKSADAQFLKAATKIWRVLDGQCRARMMQDVLKGPLPMFHRYI